MQFTRMACPKSMLGPCTRGARAYVHMHIINERVCRGRRSEAERGEKAFRNGDQVDGSEKKTDVEKEKSGPDCNEKLERERGEKLWRKRNKIQ